MIDRNINVLTREEFVIICTQIILDIRKEITMINQFSGYLKYHREIKENNYFQNMWMVTQEYKKKFGYSLFFKHELIKYAKMAYCLEAAEYLAFEIIKKLKGIHAQVMIVESLRIDHGYCTVYIHLKDEKEPSLWEIDAWDPRIIDVSMRPDGTIKNEDMLIYGSDARVEFSTFADEFIFEEKLFHFNFPEPIKGPPRGDATPRGEIYNKHKNIWKDHTLENAFKKKKLDENGNLHYPQKKSKWQ